MIEEIIEEGEKESESSDKEDILQLLLESMDKDNSKNKDEVDSNALSQKAYTSKKNSEEELFKEEETDEKSSPNKNEDNSPEIRKDSQVSNENIKSVDEEPKSPKKEDQEVKEEAKESLPNLKIKEKEKARFVECLQLKLFKQENSIRNLVVEELQSFQKRETQYKHKLDKLHQEYSNFHIDILHNHFYLKEGPVLTNLIL